MSAAVAPVLAMDGLFKAFGGVVATRDVSLDIRKGEIHALIGPSVTPPDIADTDYVDLPDLGSAFNDATVWRYHLAALQQAGLSIRTIDEV